MDTLTPNRALGQRIRERRRQLGWSQQQLADAAGYRSRSSVNKIEMGQTEVSAGKLALLAQALQTTAAQLMGAALPPNALPMPEVQRVPLLGNIACGAPRLATEQGEEQVPVPAFVHADFALRCQGDSMVGAGIRDGDLVYIVRQDDVDDGQIAAVMVGEEATLKRVRRYPNCLMLLAENPDYPPLIYTAEDAHDIRILGRAVAYTARIR